MRTSWTAGALAAAAAGALALAGVAQAASPQITDGSFEEIAAAPNDVTDISGQTVGGWSGNSLGGVQQSIYNGEVLTDDDNFAGATPFGAQYLVLGAISHRSFHAVESQSVTGFDVGKTYAISLYFAVMNRTPGTDFGSKLPSGIEITASDGTSGSGDILAEQTFTSDNYGPFGYTTVPFEKVTLQFTATSDSATFSLNNISYHSNIGIDNVSLAEVAPAPEPSTWALMTLGVGLAGAALRRRRGALAAA